MIKIFRRAIIIVRYCFFEDGFVSNTKKHLKLLGILKPLKIADLITYNTCFIYLFSYLSRALSVNDKFNVLVHHYGFLNNNFSERQLALLLKSGIECYKENDGENEYQIVLTSSAFLEIEGSLTMFLKVDNIKIASLSFSFAPGEIFGIEADNIIHISCLQRFGKQIKNIEKAKKHFGDILPAFILLKSIEAFACFLGVEQFVGICVENQLSFKDVNDHGKYYAAYDEFWKINGGQLINGSYVIPCPIPQKDILSIKQTHRNRVRRKRQKLNSIFVNCHNNINTKLSKATSTTAVHYDDVITGNAL